MRWFVYFILAYLAMGLQIGLAPYITFRGAAPNFGLLAMIFIAANAPRDAALLGCFAIGLLQDLLSQQQPGLFAFSYGLIAWLITGAQQPLVRHSLTAQTLLTFAGGILTTIVLLLQSWLHPAGPAIAAAAGGAALPAIRISASSLFLGAIYTTVLAPIVLGLLNRGKKLFAFAPGSTRRTGRRRAWMG
ncbi:MAG TPA: rod shape-determining protein MreD [Tepidisphaeraceae bacterium]|jgi:rod shape-determining protein MreD|nr:rod shape-determining protein MreD [Tepidisphaeraceae bacterium]